MKIDPQAFDAFAETYDADFTTTPLGRLLRDRVWETVEKELQPASHLLELTCGTGVDAAYLAQSGHTVVATDASERMLQMTMARANRLGVANRVSTTRQALQDFHIDSPFVSMNTGRFDGVLSNFGGLNTIGHYEKLAQALGALVKPAGRLILVPMGPFCPWELLWHLRPGQLHIAFRRWRTPAVARIGDASIPVWYPGRRRLQRDFAPWFKLRYTSPLGVLLPPSYLGHIVTAHQPLFTRLNAVERRLNSVLGASGDHYIVVFERKGS